MELVRYRLIAAKWLLEAEPKKKKVLEGYYSEKFVKARNKEGYNVYYMPNCSHVKLEKPYLKGKDITDFQYIFVDMDLKDEIYKSKETFLERIAEFEYLPTLTVDSGHGIHCYWRLENLTREEYIYLQFVLINEFNTDTSMWTVLQIMRMPKSLNVKKKDAFEEVKVISSFSSSKIYNPDDLIRILPEITEDQHKKIIRHINKIEGIEDAGLSDITGEMPEKFLNLLEDNSDIRELFEDPISARGDRSSADMVLANRLFSFDFNKKEAIAVLMNTMKARSRSDPYEYAEMTVTKVYSDRPKFVAQSIGYYDTIDFSANLGTPVNGSKYWDRLTMPWRTKQVLGLVGGTGSGKTSYSLKNFKDMIQNNPDRDNIFLFFTLEMSAEEILGRWKALTGNEPEYKDRLFIVSNEDEKGNPRYLNLQDIYHYCVDTEKSTGKKILAICIDHLDAINTSIELRRSPNFRASGKACEYRGGAEVSLKKGELCAIAQDIAKQLDVFIILQSQTTKDKDRGGDIPLSKNAAFGTSKFEWYANFIVTLWKPLKRVHDRTDLRVVGWKYAKIRDQKETDDVEEGIDYLLKFDQAIGEYGNLENEAEKAEIKDLLEVCNELRTKEKEKKFSNYRWSPKDIKRILRKNGRKK